MISGYIVKKDRMINVYTPEGKRIAVTQCTAAPLIVTQIKSTEKDGYVAVQLAYGAKKKQNNAIGSKLKKLKLDISPKSFKEFSLTTEIVPNIGDKIEVASVLTAGDEISATGTSKGRGFAGVIKRYGFQRQPVSGGQSDRVRAPGAIGAQTPGKVLKGKKMPGHYGNKTKTISGLKIYAVNPEKNQILITGPIPGVINSWVVINKV
jgi:large subunit ribosomal protein L3